MKRYSIKVDKWTEYGGELEFSELSICESAQGLWCKFEDVQKLLNKITRMQQRIDLKEGRIQIEE